MNPPRTYVADRLWSIVAIGIAMAIALVVPSTVLADSEADNLEFIIVSDDIRKEVTNIARPDGAEGSGPAAAGSGDDGAGKSNNGHGNNADGVDSSNPGQGGGGPNGAEDPSGSVDDEAGGGGASPSKGKKK